MASEIKWVRRLLSGVLCAFLVGGLASGQAEDGGHHGGHNGHSGDHHEYDHDDDDHDGHEGYAPEIDASLAGGAAALTACGVLVLTTSRRRRTASA